MSHKDFIKNTTEKNREKEVVVEKEFYEQQCKSLEVRRRKTVGPSKLRKLFRRHDPSRQETVVKLLEGNDKLLELACGVGNLLVLVRSKFKEVYAVDISLESLRIARENLIKRYGTDKGVYFIETNLNNKFPFPDAFFDSVSAMAILEHVFNVYNFIEECYRVLKPGGILIIEVPNIAYIKHRVKLLFGGLPITSSPYGWREGFGWDGGHLHYFTKKALCRLLKETGFEIKTIIGSRGLFWKYRNYWVSLLADNLLCKAIKVKK